MAKIILCVTIDSEVFEKLMEVKRKGVVISQFVEDALRKELGLSPREGIGAILDEDVDEEAPH